MNRKALWVWVLGLFLWHAPALATAQPWSTVGGHTVGQGATAIDAGLGWPGLHVGLAHGVLSNIDFGVRLSFNWGVEGSVKHVHPGVKLQGLLKAKLFDDGFLSFALKFEPGFLAYFRSNNNSMWGFALPVGAHLGLVAAKPLLVGIHVDMPMLITFGRGSRFYVPLLMGGGVEYFFNSKLAANFILRLGPSFDTRSGSALFVMDAKIGIAYRF